MSKNLFKDIHRVFPAVDPENASHTSALERVNDLLLNMREKSKELFNLNENLSIDEAMIKVHGKQQTSQPKEVIQFTPLQMDTLAMCGILKFIYVHPNGRRDSPRELWKRCART